LCFCNNIDNKNKRAVIEILLSNNMSDNYYNNDALNTGIKNHEIKPITIPGLIWYYGLWIVLAMMSAVLGYSSISTNSALFLLGGIASTNFFFLMIAYSEPHTRGLSRLLAHYQAIMAIAWVSAYYYFSTGANDLVLGMYMTLLMFSAIHLNARIVLKLAIGTLSAYLLIFTVSYLSMPVQIKPTQEILRFLVLSAVTGWVYMFACRLRDLRFELQYRNEELQTVVERVTRIAERDYLTKSYNRRYIMDVLARERSRSDRAGNTFSVLLFDLDRFKDINDRFGHLVGDQVLSDFARYVKEELRGMDMLNNTEHKRSFGRYGGEEFIAVLPGTDLRGAEKCAERIRELISSIDFHHGYSLTVSVGVAQHQQRETIPQLLTRTDEALYTAKRSGRNLVRCSEPPVKQERSQTRPDSRPNLRVLK
jgi:diguanylate cyclase (GGDEF)-like protein